MRFEWEILESGWVFQDYRCDRVEGGRWQAFYKDAPIAPVQCLTRSRRAAEKHGREHNGNG